MGFWKATFVIFLVNVICVSISVVAVDPITSPGENTPPRDTSFSEGLELLGAINKPVIIPVNQDDCPPCVCGRANTGNRIVGGTLTSVHQYPWMVMIKYKGTPGYCGGTLITDRHVLTAAHCTNTANRVFLDVILMEYDFNDDTETQAIRSRVKWVYIHPDYKPGTKQNDIAVLSLETVLEMSENLGTICLPDLENDYAGYDGIVTGWGATGEGLPSSSTLLEVTVPIISNADCMLTPYGDQIFDDMMCAGYPEGQKDSCQGDSGGPLHILNQTSPMEEIYQQVGIVSWGNGCARPSFPGVYSRVSYFIDWIQSVTTDGCYCSYSL